MKEKKCIGVDVSKRTLDFALYTGKFDMKKDHVKVSNDIEGYSKFMEWARNLSVCKEHMRVCMEHTGLYCHDFCKWLEREGIIYYMVPGMTMHNFTVPEGTKGMTRSKTDKLDAFKIAVYCYLYVDVLTPHKMPSEPLFILKRLLAERRQYIKQVGLYKRQLKDISRYDTKKSVCRKKKMLADIEGATKRLDKEILKTIACNADIQENYDLLCSIPGMGMVNALNAIVLTGNFCNIKDPRKYACYIAIAPFPKESGTSVNGKPHVGKKGFSQAKADLSMSAVSCIANEPLIRAYFNRKKKEGKPGGVVLNAIKFKMVLRMFAVIRRKKPYVKLEHFDK